MEGAGFAADWLVGFPVKSDGSRFSGCDSSCINSYGYVHAVTNTQVYSKDSKEQRKKKKDVIKNERGENQRQKEEGREK